MEPHGIGDYGPAPENVLLAVLEGISLSKKYYNITET